MNQVMRRKPSASHCVTRNPLSRAPLRIETLQRRVVFGRDARARLDHGRRGQAADRQRVRVELVRAGRDDASVDAKLDELESFAVQHESGAPV